jgi:hypothetical protein
LPRERVHVSIPPAGKLAVAGGGLLLVVMVALLVAQLTVLADSREHIQAQDRKINRIVKGTDPVLDELRPVADDARGAFRQATPLVRDLRATMVPLLRELRGADLAGAIDVTTRLVTSLERDGRFVRLVDQGNELIDALRASEFIPRTLRAADLAPEAFRVATDVLDVQRRTLHTQRRTLKVQRQTRAIQKETRAIQKQTLVIQQRLLAIQEEALVHIRSIDRKTVGPPPDPTAPAAPVPAPPR